MRRASARMVALLLVVWATADVAARGGRGGGGFARGGFSRGGVAAGGSFGGSRGGGGAQRGGYDRRGPAASGTFAGRSSDRHEWNQQNVERRQDRRDERRDERREDWQEHAGERREDWQDYLEDHRDERYQAPVYYYGDYYPYGDDYADGGEVIVEGDTGGQAVEAPPNWTLDCDPVTVILGSTTYYQCGSAWYVRVFSGGEIAYTMVNPPAGR